jgi:hypothetical protein
MPDPSHPFAIIIEALLDELDEPAQARALRRADRRLGEYLAAEQCASEPASRSGGAPSGAGRVHAAAALALEAEDELLAFLAGTDW